MILGYSLNTRWAKGEQLFHDKDPGSMAECVKVVGSNLIIGVIEVVFGESHLVVFDW